MKVTLRILLSLFLGLFVLAASSMISFINALALLGKSYPWLPFTHTAMLTISLILIYLLSKGKISTYGLKMIKIEQLKQSILVGSVGGVIIGSLSLLLPMSGFDFAKEFSLFQVVIFVWVYASISEEFLTRGLVQGFLAPLTRYRFRIFNFHISIPILVAALFFGFMHMGLLTMQVDKFTVFAVVFFGIILGIIAGYYREISGSIIPAIVIHMLFNVWGTILGSLSR
jgi:membrane protease YdiL (CAAX protease family)